MQKLLKQNIMNLQYIINNQGVQTGVFIHISDWNKITNKYKDLKNNFIIIPEKHIALGFEAKIQKINAFEYCGKIKLNKDALQIQKEMRDEWE